MYIYVKLKNNLHIYNIYNIYIIYFKNYILKKCPNKKKKKVQMKKR